MSPQPERNQNLIRAPLEKKVLSECVLVAVVFFLIKLSKFLLSDADEMFQQTE